MRPSSVLGGPPDPIRSFRFRPRPRPPQREEERRFHSELRSALRVAAGLGRPLRLRWDSGGSGGVAADCFDAQASNWFRHVLGPAYGPGYWSVGPGAPSSSPEFRFAALAGSETLPLPFAVDRPPWADIALAGLAASPPGMAVEWVLEPGVPAIRRAPEPMELGRSGGRPSEARPCPSSPVRELRDRTEERARSIGWTVRGRLRAAISVPAEIREQCCRLLSCATRLEGGNAVRFVRPIPGWRRRAPGMLFSEPELVGL